VPVDIRRSSSAGHEIGNHSIRTSIRVKSPELIEKDSRIAQTTIGDVTGTRPTLVRAPFGVRWPGFRQMQAKLRLTGVMWTVIGLDWKLPAGAIADRVLSTGR